MTVDSMDFGQHVLFWIYEYYFEIFQIFMSQTVNMLRGVIRRCVCLTNGYVMIVMN
jgi:hypothetical protein